MNPKQSGGGGMQTQMNASQQKLKVAPQSPSSILSPLSEASRNLPHLGETKLQASTLHRLDMARVVPIFGATFSLLSCVAFSLYRVSRQKRNKELYFLMEHQDEL